MARNPVEDLGYLYRARSFSHLQEIAVLLKSFYPDPVDLSGIEKVTFYSKNIDRVALSILKRENLDCQTTKPITTLGDGNCLFNAASMALCGSAKLASELRLRTAIELILHIDFYANHPHVANAAIPVCNSRHKNENYTVEGMYFATVFSSEAATLLVKHGFRSALELEIKTTTRLGNFSGLTQIMGLSSAMGCKISMVYPDKCHSMLPLLAGTYNPRQLTLSATTTLCLMWTDMGGWPDRSKIFKVNHFVLMATVNEEWHVISRRRKSRVENFTKPNLPQRNYSVADMVPPAKKCNKFEEAPPNFAKSNDSLTKSSSKKPTHTKPALTKPTCRNSFPATMKPVSKKPIGGNITCSKIPTKVISENTNLQKTNHKVRLDKTSTGKPCPTKVYMDKPYSYKTSRENFHHPEPYSYNI